MLDADTDSTIAYITVKGSPCCLGMSLFARDCMKKMKELVRELEVTLGPDTADLANRFGLHSGPCTAGVVSSRDGPFSSVNCLMCQSGVVLTCFLMTFLVTRRTRALPALW